MPDLRVQHSGWRYHNPFSKKLFCSSCGARLAKELSSADGKTRIYVNSIHVTYVNKALYAYFLRETGLTDFPGWVRELADADFGIYLCDEESVDQLKKAVSEALYDSIREWLQYRMRLELDM